jgi:putative nucleotidyltransferase with HDIG domain
MGKEKTPVYRVVSGGTMLDFAPLHGKNIDDDLMNRDFTINSLGCDLSSEKLIDPVGGRDDITSGTIRLNSREAILADPLRMLRGFRLGAALGFDITPDTLAAIAEQVPLIAGSAGERIKSELFKLMETEGSFPYLEQLAQIGLLGQIIPELASCNDCPPGGCEQSIFKHVMRTYREMEQLLAEYPSVWAEYAGPMRRYLERNHRKVLLKLAALLHDIGKPLTYSRDETGRVRYLTHEDKGARIAGNICTRLKMSVRERLFVDLIVRNHLHPLHLFDANQRGILTNKGVVRFFWKYADDVPGLLLHSLADQRAKVTHSTRSGGRFMVFLDEMFHRYFNAFNPISQKPRLISGQDLITHFGLTPSKRFGELLHSVEEARLTGEIQTREEALALVDSIVSEKRLTETAQERDR